MYFSSQFWSSSSKSGRPNHFGSLVGILDGNGEEHVVEHTAHFIVRKFYSFRGSSPRLIGLMTLVMARQHIVAGVHGRANLLTS